MLLGMSRLGERASAPLAFTRTANGRRSHDPERIGAWASARQPFMRTANR